MSEPIFIKTLSGIKRMIAQSCDSDNNGILEKSSKVDEISIFNQRMSGHTKTQESIFQMTDNYNPDISVFETDSIELVNPRKEAEKLAAQQKAEICQNLYEKWSGKFKNSPLKQEFYEKLYDVIDVLKVSVSDWNKEEYTSPKEQAMDEVCAILAGESALNPQTENGIYKGLFQLASLGLVDAKKWAQENKDVPGMKNINPKLTIKQFQKLDGEAQLDYLIAYIGKSKEYSKIGADEQITPGQLWAMIKYPFKGKNKGLINAKTDSIQNVFKNSKIAHGAIQ